MKMNIQASQFIDSGQYLKAIEILKVDDYRSAVYLALKIHRKDIAFDICLDHRDFQFIKYIQHLEGLDVIDSALQIKNK